MTDPVIEAARRAWDARDPLEGIAYVPGDRGIWTPEAMEAAASEAFKTVRELHHKTDDGYCAECVSECGDNVDWPCVTAKRIYPIKELEPRSTRNR